MKKVYVMTEEKEIKLTPSELTTIVLVCPKCGAEQGLDLSSKNQTERLQNLDRFFKCGICGDGYEIPLKQALQALLKFHEDMNQSQTKVFFRIHIKESNKNKDDKQ